MEERLGRPSADGALHRRHQTGEVKTIHKANDWLNHLLFSPTDPTLLMFCHEGPWHKVDRIWTIRTDGSQVTEDSYAHDGDGDLRPRVLGRGRQDDLVRSADAARRGFLASRLQRRYGRAHLVSPAARRMVDPLQRDARRQHCSAATAAIRARWRARQGRPVDLSFPSGVASRTAASTTRALSSRACCGPSAW